MKVEEIKKMIFEKDNLIKRMLKAIANDEFKISFIDFVNKKVIYDSKKYTIELSMKYLFIDDVKLFDSLYDSISGLNKKNTNNKDRIYEYYC